ncbi:hypothetical protein [Bartonella tamiae]|nr:hypothetical protein [Bartonella tamiae]
MTSANGPIIVVKATGEARQKFATATAHANSKLFSADVKAMNVVFG